MLRMVPRTASILDNWKARRLSPTPTPSPWRNPESSSSSSFSSFDTIFLPIGTELEEAFQPSLGLATAFQREKSVAAELPYDDGTLFSISRHQYLKHASQELSRFERYMPRRKETSSFINSDLLSGPVTPDAARHYVELGVCLFSNNREIGDHFILFILDVIDWKELCQLFTSSLWSVREVRKL